MFEMLPLCCLQSRTGKWHGSDAGAGLTVKTDGEHSGNYAPCFNTLREASKALETEPVSGTATRSPLRPDLEFNASGICGLCLLGCTQ